ncbi:hypothetical protein F5Y16DRAFT_389706 [Xylariaceae sp. FL0255]|nr:hypothetical protein F5Y16DRAFT_389706 [Xylariaceae sp. FL0255]
MAPRTSLAGQDTFTRPAPSAVTYDLSTANQASIHLPPGSEWTSGAHWHDDHTEYLEVISGYAEIILNGKVLPEVGAADGVVTVPRGAIHEWRRSRTAGSDEVLEVREWTDPRDGGKEVFFRNLNGLILDAIRDGEGSWRMRTLELELNVLFMKQDNWPAFLDTSWWSPVQGIVSRFVVVGSAALGYLLGCRGIYDEYTRTTK